MQNDSPGYAVLIDRDGTMGGNYYMKHPQEYAPYPGTREAFQALRCAGVPAYIVTNQSCIARGLDGGYDFAAEFLDIGASDWFICPHDTQDHCHCRKPETGLIEQAREKHNLDLPRCYMVGDRWTDMLAGGRMHMKLVLVKSGRGNEALGKDRKKWAGYMPEYVANDLLDAINWILRREKTKRFHPEA